MTYEVKIKALDKNSKRILYTYAVKAENVLEAEEVALKKLEKDIPRNYVTAGQYHVKSIEYIGNLEEVSR